MTLSKTALRNLRKRLPPGAIQDIATNCEVSQPLVSQVLAGSRRNERVLEEAIAYAERHERKMAQLEQRAMGRTLQSR